MRGKLRDKRIITKSDFVKREALERRRPAKRDARSSWLNNELEEDELELELVEEGESAKENSSSKQSRSLHKIHLWQVASVYHTHHSPQPTQMESDATRGKKHVS